MKSEQLLTQGKIFEDEILARPECTNNPAEEVPEPYDHAQNLTGTLPIELAAKSLILRVYDVLMNASRFQIECSSLSDTIKSATQGRGSSVLKVNVADQVREYAYTRHILPARTHNAKV